MRSGRRVLGTLASRGFWTPRARHAAIGALFTVVTAVLGVVINERLKRQIGEIDRQIADVTRRVDTLDRLIFQYDLFAAQKLNLAVMATASPARPDLVANIFAMALIDNAEALKQALAEALSHAPAELPPLVEQVNGLVAATRAGDGQAHQRLMAFEQEKITFAREVRSRLHQARFDLQRARKAEDDRLDTWQAVGLGVQQAGFLVILFVGLFLQRERGNDAPEPVAAPPPPQGE
ncbi:MAG: hypothetical protein AB7O45_07620 [Alphaproteobacteria bacterium]